jgi:hypothetical protein
LLREETKTLLVIIKHKSTDWEASCEFNSTLIGHTDSKCIRFSEFCIIPSEYLRKAYIMPIQEFLDFFIENLFARFDSFLLDNLGIFLEFLDFSRKLFRS